MRVALVFAILLILLSFGLTECYDSKKNFANDPISWSFVGGDGSWDSNTRKWTVYLTSGETKSVTIRLHNSSSRNIKVYTVSTVATDLIQLSPQMRVPIIAGGSVDIIFTATALNGASGEYTIDYGYSFNEEKSR